MSKEFVRDVLSQDADNNVPINANLWPAIHSQVRLTRQVEQIMRPTRRLGLSFQWRPLLLASIFAVVLAIGAMFMLAQPAPVGAEEVLARAEQAAKLNATGLQSFYGNYLFQYRNSPNAAFIEMRQETWFQAPNKYAYKHTTRLENGQESVISNGADGTYSYNYVSEYNELRLQDAHTFPGDPTTGTLQVLLFSPANLGDALERARRKLPPPQNPKSAPRPPYMYDVKLLGEERVLDRPAYVIEMMLVPGSSLQLPDRQVPEKMKMWVDRELYAVLRMEGWDTEGHVLQSGVYESFQVNQGGQSDIRSFIAPPGVDILDLRLASDQEIESAWQEAVQRASYGVFIPSYLPEGLTPGRPLYDAERAVISQVFQGEVLVQMLPSYDASTGEFTVLQPKKGQQPGTKQVTLSKLVIFQGSPASIKEDGLGESTPVQIGKLTGRLYSRGGAHTLIFDASGTRIKLYAPAYVLAGASSPTALTTDQIIKIAEGMQAVVKK